MFRSKIVAALLAAALTYSPASVFAGGTPPPPPPASSSSGGAPVAVWLIFGCASGIIFAAAVANARDNRPLTAGEAATCGLLFLFSSPRRR